MEQLESEKERMAYDLCFSQRRLNSSAGNEVYKPDLPWVPWGGASSTRASRPCTG